MSAALTNPLLDLHRQAEAELQPYGEFEIVSTFGEPQAEYAAIRKSAGLNDLHEIALHGAGAAAILSESIDQSLGPLQLAACGLARFFGQDAIVWRDDPCGVPGYHIVVPSSGSRAIWMHLLTRFGSPDQ